MRTNFFEYIGLSDKDKKELWDMAVFVFDTNILLNLYRSSKNTRETLIAAIKSFSDRVWLPHQVCLEFFKRRVEVIYECSDRYDLLEKETESFAGKFRENLRLDYDDNLLWN